MQIKRLQGKEFTNRYNELIEVAYSISNNGMKTMIIELPNWARIGLQVLVKDTNMVRGDNPNDWYTERIIAFGYDGVFHQAKNCPMYFTEFNQYGKTIKLKEE